MNKIPIDDTYHLPTLADLAGADNFYYNNGYLHADCSQEALESAKNIYSGPVLSSFEKKIVGIDFQGVMCSATAEDQHGLSDIESFVLGGNPVNFKFENGTSLVLTAANWVEFRTTWVTFRQSFFPLP